jgi:NADH:ubiquinone oxidoreductase subunit 6 (subunit J)
MLIYNLLCFLFILFFFLSVIHESIFFSIFFLIALFLVSSFLFLLLGFEFIGFLYLIVYVGAIAVLFLFMVMLFDKSEYLFFSTDYEKSELKEERNLLLYSSFPLSFIFGFFLFVSFSNLDILCFYNYPFGDLFFSAPFSRDSFIEDSLLINMPFNLGTNLQRVGFLLYTYFSLSVLGAGVVLLVGMIGAIVLTQTFFFGGRFKKHQEIKDQIVRKRS